MTTRRLNRPKNLAKRPIKENNTRDLNLIGETTGKENK